MARARGRRRVWTRRRLRAVCSLAFLGLVLTTATQSATAAQLTPGRSPVAMGASAFARWWRDAERWMAAPASLPTEHGGSGAAAHSTRADKGTGRAPGKGAGQLPPASTKASHAAAGKSSTITRGFDAKTSKPVPAKSNAYDTWWQNADGTLTEQVSQSVVNYKNASGAWEPIDTTLTKGSDGRWQVTAAGYGLSLAPGAAASANGRSNAAASAFDTGADALSTPFTAADSATADPNAAVSAAAGDAASSAGAAQNGGSSTGTLATVTLGSGQSVAWSLAGAASVAAAESGDTVTYPSILPDTDLALSSEPSGVKESLTLSSAAAPNSWTFPLTLTGLTLVHSAGGAWQLVDSAGEPAATLQSPFAVDSSRKPSSLTQAVSYSLATVNGVEELTMTLAPSWLDSPARVFPVTVDPTITVSTAGSGLSTYADDLASDAGTNYSTAGVLKVGNDGTGVDRSFVNFPSTSIGSSLQNTGFHITAASFAAFTTSGTSSSEPFDVYSLGQSWSPSTLTWNNQPGAFEDLGTYSGSASSSTTCTGISGSGNWLYTTLSASDMNVFSLDQYSWEGLEIASDNTSAADFHSFASAGNSACSPYLSLTYTPDVLPTLSTMSPAGGAVLSTLTPQFTASGTDADAWPNATVQYEFEVFNAGGSTVLAHSSLQSTGSWTVPTGTLEWGQTYQWSVCVFDGYACNSPQSYNAFETSSPGPILGENLSQSTSGHGFDVASGNYTTSSTDANIAGAGPSLAVVRDYNSLDTRQSGAFGSGWSSMIDATATQELDSAGNLLGVAVTYPDGSVVVYGYNSNGTYSAPAGRFATLLPLTSSGALIGYALTDKTGTTYTFGYVATAAVAGSGSGVYKTAGVYGISQVTDVAKRPLNFVWGVTGGVAGSHVVEETNTTSGRTLYFSWTTPSGAVFPHVSVVTTSYATAGNSATAQYWSYGYTGDELTTMCAPSATAPATPSSACTGYSYQNGSDYQQATLDSAPYQYWPMDDVAAASSSLSQVYENVGAGRAFYTSMTADTSSTPGPMAPIGSGADGGVFNGSSSFMSLPTGMVLNTTYLSVGLWFKTTSSGPLFTVQNNTLVAGGTPSATMSLYVGTDGYLRGGWFTGSVGASSQIEDTRSSVNDGKWHYVVLSGAGATQTMYVDGLSVGSLSGTIDNQGQTYEYVGAGYSSGEWPKQAAAGNWYFKGSVSDVSFYNSALPATDVSSLYGIATTPSRWLTGITKPRAASNSAEAAAATVAYNIVDGRVSSVTDENGATWGLGAPSVVGSSQVFRETVMGDQPALYYRFADTSGTDPADEVNADAWANAGMAATSNAVGFGTVENAFSDATTATFNGTSSYVQLPNALTSAAPVSIGLWFKAASGTNGPLWSEQNTAYTEPTPTANAPANATNELYIGTNGLLYGSFSMGKTTAIASKDKVNDGNWHYAVLSASATSESLYVDGTLEGTETGTYVYDGQDVNLIGAGYSAGGQSAGEWQNQAPQGDWFFNGSISDAAFFHSQLSQAQVTQIWQAYQASVGTVIPLEQITVSNPVDTFDNVAYKDMYEFDPSQAMRVVAYTQGATNGTTTYSYDTNGFLDVVTDPNGDQTITGHDVRGNAVSTTTCQYQALNECSTSYKTYYPDDTTASFTASTWDPRDDLVVTSSDGRSASSTDTTYRTSYSYDQYGNLLTQTDPSGHGVTNVYTTSTAQQYACNPTSTTLGVKSTTQYAPVDLLYTSTTTGGAVTTYSYYPDGDTCAVDSPDGLETFFTYDGLGRVLTKTVTGAPVIPAGLVAYDASQVTTYTYDGDGRVLQTTAPAVTDRVTGAVHTAQTTNTYDADGDVLTTTVADTTGGDYSRTASYVYNDYDQKQSYTSADGNSSTNMSGATIAGQSGHTETFTYDVWGNVQKQTDALPGTAARTVETLYDGADQLRKTEQLNTSTSGTYSADATLVSDQKTYDAAGRLESDEDAEGDLTCYYYYDDNLLYQEIATSSSCPTSAYPVGTNGDVTHSEVVSTSLYNGAGDVTTEYTNNGVTETQKTYNPDGTVATTTVDPSGVDRTTAYTYDKNGDVIETVQEGKVDGAMDVVSDVKETYDGLGDVMTTTVVDGSNSYTTTYTLDQRGLPTQVQDPDGNVTYTTYDEDSRLVQTDELAVPVTLWCQTATSYPVCTAAGASVSLTVPVITTVGYDTFGDQVESESPDAAEYTGTGKATAAPASTVTTYDAEGNKTSVTLPTYTAPGAGSPTASTTLYQYDADGELTNETDPIGVASSGAKGEQISYTYTMFGTVAGKTITDLSNPTAPATTTYTYDADARALSSTVPISSGRSETTGDTYDYLNRVLTSSATESDPTDGHTTGYTYPTTNVYGAGGWLASTTTPDGDTTSFAYDNIGEKTSSTDDLTHSTDYAYDGDGRLATTTEPNGTYSQATYDEAGNETSTADYSATGAELSGQTMSYDDDGRLAATYTQTPGQTSYNSANTEETSYQYDPSGLLESETAPLTGSSTVKVSYTYDPAGNQTGYTSGNGNTTYTTYNSWNLPEDKVVPATSTYTNLAARTTTTGYDADGRADLVSEPVAGSGSTPITVSSTYDGFGDLASETSAGAEGLNTTRTFTYDESGMPLSASTENSSGTTLTTENYAYDDRGDLLSATGTGSASAGDSSFTYNGDGQELSRTDASGTTSYGYNTDDQLTSLQDAATGTTVGYTYNNEGQVSTASYGSGGDTQTFGYNTANELSSDTLTTPSDAKVSALTYTWDTDGDLLSKTDSAGANNTYGYDASGRLVNWTEGTSSITYSYDADSNRTGISTANTSTGATTSDETLTYDARDELTGTTDSVTTASSAYDYTARGTTSQVSTVSSTGATATTAYADDAFGQQTSAGQGSYTYDALGRMTSLTDGGTTTDLQYSGTGNEVASDGTNTYSRDPDGGLVGTADATAGTSSLLWTDDHTDVVGEFSADGTALSGTETYNPLGAVTSDTGAATALTVGYQSEWTDPTTGDVNMAARWYNPKTGQFTSADTVQNSAVPNPAAANPFAYGNGDPLNGTDPTGHMYAINLDGYTYIGDLPAVQEEIQTHEFNQAVVKAVPSVTVEQLVSADNALHRAEVDAQSVADAEAAPVKVGMGHMIIGPNGQMGSPSALRIEYAREQLDQDEDKINDLINQFVKADANKSEHCSIDPTSWGGCVHNSATWVENNPLVKDVVTAAAGVVVAGTCLVATGGAGSVGCAALGGAAANGLNYAIGAAATGHGSLAGFATALAVGAAAGAAAAATGGAVGGLIAGTLGDSVAATVATNAITGFAAGAVGGAVGGGGSYLAGCGSSCSLGGFAGATGEGFLEGGATGAVGGVVGGGIANGSSASASDDAGVGAAAENDGTPGETCEFNSFIGSTDVVLAGGTVKPIDQIKVGDEIENSAPGKSGTQVHKVAAVIVTTTDHDFVDLTIKPSDSTVKASSGSATSASASTESASSSTSKSSPSLVAKLAKSAVALTAAAAVVIGAHAAAATKSSPTHTAAATAATLTTTFHHPFYDVTQGAFVQAQYLKAGDQLQTPTGDAVITDVQLFHGTTTTYNLTIDSLHTFYVLAGQTPVLVHNCGPSVNVATPRGVVQTEVSGSSDLQAYADFLRPNYNKVDGPVYAAKFTSTSGRSYFGYAGHGLIPEEGSAVDTLVREFAPDDGRYHAGCAETMCLMLAESAEGAEGIQGGSMEAVRVRGLNSGPDSVHGDSASPCPLVCQPRLNNQGISYEG